MRHERREAASGRRRAAAWVILAVAALPVGAQQIVVDQPIRAGELNVFPSVRDPNVYYYVVDQPRLATDDNGRAQFSFLRFVENVRSGATEDEIDEGEGGGIVHALVSLQVTEEQRRDAQRELQRLRPGARLEGPVVFKSGHFGLVSSFTDPEGNLSTQVVGIGNAPLLDGEKAAVSIQLTKLGAKILWESFQTPTPDISFTFEMDIDGYLSPKRALIEANFDQVYEHESFGAGLASTYLSAEIQAAFDDLRRTGAIKLTQIGEDAKLDELVTAAYGRLVDMMFQPVNGTGTPSLSGLQGAAGQQSLLDRAGAQLEKGRAEAQRRNEAIQARNRERRTEARGDAQALTERANRAEERARALTERATQAEARAEQLRGAGEADESDEDAAARRELADQASAQAVTVRRLADEAERDAADLRRRADQAPGGGATDGEEDEVSAPAFAIVAAYEMKRVRQSGTFTIDLNKYTATSMTLRFDENIGDLRRFWGDQTYFRQVNLDDDLFRQRELVAFVDGLNAADFGDYINFVSVQMRKRHAAGAESADEVRVDRNNFNSEGNRFKLLYGWKDDRSRSDWLTYDYKTTWSFFGGFEVDLPWQPRSNAAIPLVPPYQRRIVTVEADPELLAGSEVRTATVKLYFALGEEERMKQVTLDVAKGHLSERIEFLAPPESYEYDYEITWRLRGNRSVSSGRQTTSEQTLFADELPEG